MGVQEARRPDLDRAWDAGLDVIDELFAADHRYHDPLMVGLPPGPEGVRAVVDALLTAMPDGTLTIDDWIEDGDSLVARWTWSGTHTGVLMGMAPTGRTATTSGMHVFRFRGDQIADTWVTYDALGMLGQLGLVTLGIALGGPVGITGPG
jgi:predicted ester cyclase